MVGTFQAAGAVAAHLFENFGGRVGQLDNQPGDRLLDSADLVITMVLPQALLETFDTNFFSVVALTQT